MCGIVGIIHVDGAPVLPQVLEAMTHAIAHRGPDGWGVKAWNQVGLGNRRLAIIDLEGGRQPLSNEDGQIWITFNGEIYNYRDLRHELHLTGHSFRTNSDTETVVHAYEQWGDRCVEHLRGMFAFGIVDLRRHCMFIARDQLGIKPLYYLSNSKCFAFASELQALHRIPDLQLSLDLQAVDQYLWLQYIPAPRTIFQQIYKLPPAHRMTISFDGKVSEPEEYWQLEFHPDYSRTETEWLEAIDKTLRDSVRVHLLADVPFGAFLSGGVDSSAVVAYMAQMLEHPVRTFSIGFTETDFDELKYAAQAARRWSTEHHVEIVKPDALAILPKLVQHYGEPFGDSSAVPTFYVSQMARGFVPMVLSGDGGDEMFAGYDSYRGWIRWLRGEGWPLWKRVLRPIAARFTQRVPPREPTLTNWLRFINYVEPARRRKLWRSEYREMVAAPLETFEREFARAHDYSPVHMAQYMDLKTYLPYDILTKVDVASMMHGLEVRTPLVDVRVAEFAATIPDMLSVTRDSNGAWHGKTLLKKALEKYYPAEFLNRPKMGFAVPIRKWFAPGGALGEELHDRLLSTDSFLHEWFEPVMIARFVDRNESGPLWLLLFLDEWLRQNKSRVAQFSHG